MKLILPFLAALLLQGCVQEPAPKPMPRPSSPIPIENRVPSQDADSCGAAKLTALLGQNKDMLQTVKLTGQTRIIPFGAMVTQDYSAGRLNLHLDENGTIARITCG